MELQWELMVFTLLVCLGAGIFGIQAFVAFTRKDTKLQLPALIASVASVGVGGIGSFLHLQHWERIFNGFGHLTSGITQEMIAIVVFIVMAVVYFIVLRRTGDEGALPKWCAVLAMIVAIGLVVIMAHSYNMAARPIWNSPVLWLYYLSNAVLFGGLMMMTLASAKKEDAIKATATRFALVGVIAQAVMTAVYVGFFALSADAYAGVEYYWDYVHPTNPLVDPAAMLTSIAFGSNALLFWLGVVAVGLIVPAVLIFLAKKKAPEASVTGYAVVGLVAALAGGMCFRVILYILGFSVFMLF